MKLYCAQLDLARQKENIAYIKSYGDFVKKCGYNGIYLYLENAVRTKDTEFFNKDDTYSYEEMFEISNYLEGIGLEVIPCFEVLPHMEKFLDYKELESLAECPNGKNRRFDEGWKNGTCACVTNPDLKIFNEQYITEVSKLFHGKYIQVGFDEVFDFAECERCKAELAKGKTKKDLFFEYVIFIYNLIKKLGKTMMMSDDFLEYFDIIEDLPRDIIMTTWSYVFVSDEVPGHWTNRVKKDWASIYKKLGFKYIVENYSHHTSSVYNAYSLYNNYYKQANAEGIVTTAWCRSESFYFASYPYMAYAVALFQGKIKNDDDAINILKGFFDNNEEIARIIYSLNLPAHFYSYKNYDVLCERDYFIKFIHKKQLDYCMPILEKYKENSNNEIFIDLYYNLLYIYLDFQIQEIGSTFYHQVENDSVEVENLVNKLDYIKEQYSTIYQFNKNLWQKYRYGIKSFKNALDNKYQGIAKTIDNIKNTIKNNKKTGILFLDLMLPDGFSTVKSDIDIKYKDNKEELSVFSGSLKSTMVNYDTAGTYGFKFLIDNKKIEYIKISVYGEGNQYIENIRALINKEKILPNKVDVVCGFVENSNNVLTSDSKCVNMGYEDALSHINDVTLSLKKSIIKIYF